MLHFCHLILHSRFLFVSNTFLSFVAKTIREMFLSILTAWRVKSHLENDMKIKIQSSVIDSIYVQQSVLILATFALRKCLYFSVFLVFIYSLYLHLVYAAHTFKFTFHKPVYQKDQIHSRQKRKKHVLLSV